MKHQFYCLVTALIFIVPAAFVHAQSSGPDVVYLKNGSKIKGTIVEMIRDRSVKIRTADSSIFVFQMSDVGTIEMNPQSIAQIKAQPDGMPVGQQQLTGSKAIFHLSFSGGVSLPTGAFASTLLSEESGAAVPGIGIALDADVSKGHGLAWLSSVVIAGNHMDINSGIFGPNVTVSSGSWLSYWLLTGFRIYGALSPTTELCGFAQLGALIGRSPEHSLRSSDVYLEQNSTTGLGVGYGIGSGLKFEKFLISVRYLGGKPEYEATAGNGSATATGKFSQPTGCWFITAGIVLH